MLKKTPESPLDSKKIKSVNPKGKWPWIFIGKTVVEAGAPILWPPDVKRWKRPFSLEKTLMLRKIEGRRRSGWQRMKCLDGITDSTDMSLSELWETEKDSEEWQAAVHGVTKSQTRLSGSTSENSRTPKAKNTLKSGQRNSRLATIRWEWWLITQHNSSNRRKGTGEQRCCDETKGLTTWTWTHNAIMPKNKAEINYL